MTRIGRYEIVAPLGKGAFGQVFRAWDPSVGRHVAIKVVTAETDADLLSRFRQEAGTTANLTHKNIVTVFDFGDHEGIPFLAMELLEGESLQDTITNSRKQSTPLTLLEKTLILAQIAEGLHYAHARGVIHRDVKPGNVVRLPDGTVKILDFGIARALNSMATRRTRDGDMVGTFLYMAPEQFRNSEADVLTDIFAFGDVAYELLASEHPFEGKDVGTIMFKITAKDPPALRTIDPNIPETLDGMVLRALSKVREMRYQSLEDVLFDLQPVIHSLRLERAQQLLVEVQPFYEAGDTEAALKHVRQILELDPSNAGARKLRDDLQGKIQQQAVRARIAVLIEQGDEAARRREYPEAISIYESALRLDKNDATVNSRIDETRTKLEAKRKSVRLLAEARMQIESGDLALALTLATQAAEADALNTEADTMIDRVNQLLTERDRRLRLEQSLAIAEAKQSAGDHTGALGALSSIESEFPGDPQIQIVRERIVAAQHEYEAQHREEKYRQRLGEIRALADSGQTTAAAPAAEALARAYPEHVEAAELADQLRRRIERERYVQEAIQAAEAAQNSSKLEQAQNILSAAITRYPDAPVLQESKLRLLAAIESADKARQIAALASAAKAQLAAKQYDSAIEHIELGLDKFPGEESLLEILHHARSARDESDKRSYIRGVLEKADALARSGNAEGALSELEAARAFYPQNEDLQLAAERLSNRLAEARTLFEQATSSIHNALSSRNWTGAISAAEHARQSYPDSDEVLDLLVKSWRELRHEEIRSGAELVQSAIQDSRTEAAKAHLNTLRIVFPSDSTIAVLDQELSRHLTAIRAAAL